MSNQSRLRILIAWSAVWFVRPVTSNLAAARVGHAAVQAGILAAPADILR